MCALVVSCGRVILAYPRRLVKGILPSARLFVANTRKNILTDEHALFWRVCAACLHLIKRRIIRGAAFA